MVLGDSDRADRVRRALSRLGLEVTAPGAACIDGTLLVDVRPALTTSALDADG